MATPPEPGTVPGLQKVLGQCSLRGVSEWVGDASTPETHGQQVARDTGVIFLGGWGGGGTR